MTNLYSKIIGSGSYLPEKILTNHDLAKIVDTSHDWIFERTGIEQRHIASENESSVDMAYKASLKAMSMAQLSPNDIDMIIVATATPERKFPSTAVLLQDHLKIEQGFAFDINAACTGFVYALDIADKYIKSNVAKNILVVGSEKMSSLLDWKDRNTCVLFGDGAGAVILSESSKPGILSTNIGSNGSYKDLLTVNIDSEFIESLTKTSEEKLGKFGRIVIRPSGTESLIRVMGEAEDQKLLEAVVDDILIELETGLLR